MGRCGGGRGRARRLRGLGRGVGGGLSRVSDVENDMYWKRFTLVVHFESCSDDIALNFVSGVGVEIKVLHFLLVVDARRGMMRGGEDGAVERRCRYHRSHTSARESKLSWSNEHSMHTTRSSQRMMRARNGCGTSRAKLN